MEPAAQDRVHHTTILLFRDHPPSAGNAMPQSDIVLVARFTYRHEAEFAAGFLGDAGIPHSVLVDDHGGHITLNNSARVLVSAEEADRAREVLREAGLETV